MLPNRYHMAEFRTVASAGDRSDAGSPMSEPNLKGINLRLNARTCSLYLAGISLVLLAFHGLAYYLFFGFPQLSTASLVVKRFGLDQDGNIPTLFSSLLLFFAAMLLFLVARFFRQHQQAKTANRWLLLGFIFIFLGVDEATQIHEFTSSIVKSVNNGPLPGMFRHAWILPYLVLTTSIVFYFFRFVLALPTRTRNQFFLAGFLYVGSALGLEMLEGLEASINGKSSFLILQMQTVEEMIEMWAIILFNYALMQYLGDTAIGVKLQTGKPPLAYTE